MAEFDFDELDKAVTSLMQKQTDQPAVQTPPDGADSVTAADTTAPAPTVEPSAVDAAPTRPPAGVETAASDSSDPVRSTSNEAGATPTTPRNGVTLQRRGKFMDVVRPPAAMVDAQATPAPRRKGNTLTPLNAGITPAPTSSIPPRAVDGISQLPSTSTPVDTTSASRPEPAGAETSDWPDPLDVMERHQAAQAASAPPAAEDSASTEAVFAASELETTGVDTSDVMSSPFLPDAKVEKRPLGAVAAETIDDTAVDSEPTDVAVNEVRDTLEDSEPSPAPGPETANDALAATSTELPEELRQDVLSLELHDTAEMAAATSTAQPATETASPTESSPETEPASVAEAPQKPLEANTTPAAPLVGALPPRQVPAASIDTPDIEPKQSIFDTDDHQPMKHQAKRSSGWLTIVIIGVIILVGVIGGVIVYLLNNGY